MNTLYILIYNLDNINYLKKDIKLKEALQDKEIGKYLKYIYYDYLDESHLNETIASWSEGILIN